MAKPLFSPKPIQAEISSVKPAQVAEMASAVQQNIQVQQSVGQITPAQSIGRGQRSTSTALANFDIKNPTAVSNYGASAQDNVAKFADEVLEYV